MSFYSTGMKVCKPYCLYPAIWLILFLPLFLMFVSCSKEDDHSKPFLILKTGASYTANGSSIPVGGGIKIGVQASGVGTALTYIRIDRISRNDTLTQVDKGLYVGSEGFDSDFTFPKDTLFIEQWRILVMNANRDTAVRSIVVFKGAGSAYGNIDFFNSITIGLQDNAVFGHFLDVNSGIIYTDASVMGQEHEIDIVSYYYVTSGLPSPTFTCPGYTSAVGYYPQMINWNIRNTTLYDYYSSDNDLISASQFDMAQNDSLLVTAYKPDKVSGNCKYGYTGKVIPFKTQSGKYGLIKVLHADENANGEIVISIKVQK